MKHLKEEQKKEMGIKGRARSQLYIRNLSDPAEHDKQAASMASLLASQKGCNYDKLAPQAQTELDVSAAAIEPTP